MELTSKAASIRPADRSGASAHGTGPTSVCATLGLGLLFSVVSPTWGFAWLLKRGRRRRARAAIICWLNHLYLSLSIVAVCVTLYAGNDLPSERPHWWSLVSFDLWGWFLLSRCSEVFYAFYRDAFDKLASVPPSSRLTPVLRVRLALNSYAELILNFALLYRLLPSSVWADSGKPSSFSDLLFYSASTITTSGSGRLVIAKWPLQLLTVYEILCGLILLVVCFAIYAGGALGKPRRRLRPQRPRAVGSEAPPADEPGTISIRNKEV